MRIYFASFAHLTVWLFDEFNFQKLISDDRFRSENEEDPESQLPVQFLSTVASTPSLADEVQVEVMKVRVIMPLFLLYLSVLHKLNILL